LRVFVFVFILVVSTFRIFICKIKSAMPLLTP